MLGTLKYKLSYLEAFGTKTEKIMSSKLLRNMDFETINELADKLSSSPATITRLVRKIDYPSFKHFHYDYNLTDNSSSHSEKKIFEWTAKNIDKRVSIITSRREKGIGKFFNERLNASGAINSNVFSETTNEIVHFISTLQETELLVIFSFTKYSYIIENTFKTLATIPKTKWPKILIITTEDWLQAFEKYPKVKALKIDPQSNMEESWTSYNIFMKKVFRIMNDLMLYIAKNKNIE